jgi:integrase
MSHIQKKRVISKRQDKVITKYQARVNLPGKREQTRSFDRLTDAQSWVRRIEAGRDRGERLDLRRAKESLREYGEDWRARQQHRSSTAARVESILRLHIYPHLGERTLGSLRHGDIERWVATLSKDHSPGTVRLYFGILSSVLTSAVLDQIIASSPCMKVPLPKNSKSEILIPDVAEVMEIAREIVPYLRLPVLLAAGTGLRLGETFGITADRVDIEHRRITIDRQLLTPYRGPAALGPLKTPTSKRNVILPRKLIEPLEVLVDAASLRESPGFVFMGPQGRPIRRGGVSENMTRAVKRAGISRTITFHSLRHHFASLLIRQGLSVAAVQKALGHASPSQTLSVYTHVWNDNEAQTIEAIDRALSAAYADSLATQPRLSLPVLDPELFDMIGS